MQRSVSRACTGFCVETGRGRGAGRLILLTWEDVRLSAFALDSLSPREAAEARREGDARFQRVDLVFHSVPVLPNVTPNGKKPAFVVKMDSCTSSQFASFEETEEHAGITFCSMLQTLVFYLHFFYIQRSKSARSSLLNLLLSWSIFKKGKSDTGQAEVIICGAA